MRLDQSVTILRRSGSTKDSLGQKSDSFTATSESPVPGFLVRRTAQGGRETKGGAEGVVTFDKVFLLPNTDVTSNDRIQVGTTVFSVDGKPYKVHGHHIEAIIKEVGDA